MPLNLMTLPKGMKLLLKNSSSLNPEEVTLFHPRRDSILISIWFL